jgi:hypothetical protein
VSGETLCRRIKSNYQLNRFKQCSAYLRRAEIAAHVTLHLLKNKLVEVEKQIMTFSLSRNMPVFRNGQINTGNMRNNMRKTMPTHKNRRVRFGPQSLLYVTNGVSVDVELIGWYVRVDPAGHRVSPVTVKIDSVLSTDEALEAIQLVMNKIKRKGLPEIACELPAQKGMFILDKLTRRNKKNNSTTV